ncbi:MAG: tetratricopeptide repeat protein, partial [Candidatus Latescibacterota bacterium]
MAEHPRLPEVERVVDELTAEVPSTRPSLDSVWQVHGPATGGKTTVLRNLAERLAARGMAPVLLQPPTRALDSGPLALVDAVGSLGRASVANGAVDQITSGTETWADKLRAVVEVMRQERNRVVVLCDEPDKWPATSAEDVHFAEHAREAALAFLSAVPCRRVVAGSGVLGLRARPIRLAAASDPLPWLRSADAWGSIAEAAEAVADRADGDLARRSPLEIRLLVALAALQPADQVMRWWSTGPSRRDLARRLAQALSSADVEWTSYLRDTWASLSLVRRPMAPELFHRLAGDAPAPEAGAVVRNCLLYESAGRLHVHWMLTLDVTEQRWLQGLRPRQIHGLLARYYRESLNHGADSSDPTALPDGAEAYYHAALSGDEELGPLRPFFADQLNLLGRFLSRDLRDYGRAAQVFGSACAWEPDDDYAHHYLAYNLDIMAEQAGEIEQHYRKAIGLRPGHAWWHSRWISYLVTRGRSADARRGWDDALDALGLPDPDSPVWVYENLHVWVARVLLHRGQLDFAEEVLHGIPPPVVTQHPGLCALARRLRVLIDARRVGSSFPVSIPPERWWSGPHLCPARQDREELARWLAG